MLTLIRSVPRLMLYVLGIVVLGVVAFYLLVSGPRYTRTHSPYGNCDLITEITTYGDTSFARLWISGVGDEDMENWVMVGHQVSRGWLVDWCGPKHVILTNLGEPRSANAGRIIKYGNIEVLELHFGAMKERVSPGANFTLWTWSGRGVPATAILACHEDSIRLLSLSEDSHIDAAWLGEYHLHMTVSDIGGANVCRAEWRGVEIDVQ